MASPSGCGKRSDGIHRNLRDLKVSKTPSCSNRHFSRNVLRTIAAMTSVTIVIRLSLGIPQVTFDFPLMFER